VAKDDDISQELSKLLEEYGKESIIALKREIKIRDLQVTSKTINSITHKVSPYKVVISFDKVLNILDRGRRKGKKRPHVDSILQWMKDSQIQPRNNRKKGNLSGRFTNKSDRNMKSSAFAIARAIGKKGTIKRFGHKGAKVFKVIRSGSNAMNNLKSGIKEVTGKQMKQSFKQLKKK
tara:strand:+ start:124 stop:654 length:531 start_codon:yes stop_codon:yes gene_type:complete